MTGTSLQQHSAQAHGTADLITRYGDEFATVLASHMRREQFVRLAIGALRRNPQLKRVADRNPASVMQALLECARLGHEPDSDAFYLVPYGDEVVGIEGYRGVIERMYRAGRVAAVKAELVHANDKFEFHPGMDHPDHRPEYFTDRGEIIGAYAYARFTDGTTSKVVLIDQAYVAKVKAESRGSSSKSSPWVKWPEQMWLKTVAKRLEPWVPTSVEWRGERPQVVEATADVVPVVEPTHHLAGPPVDHVLDDDVLDVTDLDEVTE